VSPHQVLFGAVIGLEGQSEFNPAAPYAGCRICGAVYQSDLDRLVYQLKQLPNNYIQYMSAFEKADARRTRWRQIHTRRKHHVREVAAFAGSGMAFTPEAQHALAPYGIIDFTEQPTPALTDEHDHALRQADRKPAQ